MKCRNRVRLCGPRPLANTCLVHAKTFFHVTASRQNADIVRQRMARLTSEKLTPLLQNSVLRGALLQFFESLDTVSHDLPHAYLLFKRD